MRINLSGLATEYRAFYAELDNRIKRLEDELQQTTDDDRRLELQDRIRILSSVQRGARDMAHLMES